MLRDFIDSSLQNGANIEVWFNALVEVGRRHQLEYTTFTLLPRDSLPYSEVFYKSNHPAVWQKIYEQKRYAEVDPIVRHCWSKMTPLVWGRENFIGPQEEALYEQACAFGSRWGVALPIHGPKHEVGMLCFASGVQSDEAKRDAVSSLPELGLVRDFASPAGLSLARQKPSAVAPKLTPREIECLKWMTLGKGTWEISQILSCSQSTINYHITNIRNKMGVHSRSAAMIKAVGMGLIEV
jgi:LuxR family quorum-sensing transcriptional regulator LasR